MNEGDAMARYETNINKVTGSTFAIGDNASALGSISVNPEYQEIARRLTDLIHLIREYDETDQGITDIRALAHEAQGEVNSAQPDKQRIRRVLDRMQTALNKVGPGIVGIGALADAITKIAGAIQHL
jgi:hypothetical protein